MFNATIFFSLYFIRQIVLLHNIVVLKWFNDEKYLSIMPQGMNVNKYAKFIESKGMNLKRKRKFQNVFAVTKCLNNIDFSVRLFRSFAEKKCVYFCYYYWYFLYTFILSLQYSGIAVQNAEYQMNKINKNTLVRTLLWRCIRKMFNPFVRICFNWK